MDSSPVDTFLNKYAILPIQHMPKEKGLLPALAGESPESLIQ